MDYINYAKQSPDATVLFGGNGDKTEGYYIEPTVIVTTDPAFKTMTEEIFGPVITIYVYDESQYEETLRVPEPALRPPDLSLSRPLRTG